MPQRKHRRHNDDSRDLSIGGTVKAYIGTGEYLRGFTNYLRSKTVLSNREWFDPFVALYEDDPKVVPIVPNPDELHNALANKMRRTMCNSACMSLGIELVLWPLVCPVTHCCVLPGIFADAIVSVAQVSLHENSLHYRLDDYKRQGYANNLPKWYMEQSIKGVEFVLPLQECELELLQPQPEPWVSCDDTKDLDKRCPLATLLIKSKGRIVAEVECPAYPELLIAKFDELKGKSAPRAVPPQAQRDHDEMILNLAFWRTLEEKEDIKKELNRVKGQAYTQGAAPTSPDSMSRGNESSSDISTILLGIGLPQKYVDVFLDKKINKDFLMTMDDAILTEVGVDSALERRRIVAWIQSQPTIPMAVPAAEM